MKTKDILDHLDKFMALGVVAKCGSIRKASAVLKISQPSLSVKIKGLEQVIGRSLLERSREGIFLTAAGQKAIRFVHEITAQAEVLHAELEQADGLAGHVRIGVYDSIARYLWPKFLNQFSKHYPDITFTLTTGRSKVITESLAGGDIDIGLSVAPKKWKGVLHFRLYDDNLSCFCTSLFAKRIWSQEVKGRSLIYKPTGRDISLILFPQAMEGIGVYLEMLLGEEVMANFNVHRVENFEIARTFCLESLGLAVLPNRVAEKEYQRNKLIKVNLDADLGLNFGEHTIGLSLNKGSSSRPVVELVAKELQKFIGTDKPR